MAGSPSRSHITTRFGTEAIASSTSREGNLTTTLGMRLNDRVKDIIEDHRPRALDANKKRKVQEVLSAAGL